MDLHESPLHLGNGVDLVILTQDLPPLGSEVLGTISIIFPAFLPRVSPSPAYAGSSQVHL